MALTPTEITDEQLQELCLYLSTTSYIYYPIATDFFKDLYKTGCRPMELLTIKLWKYISPTSIILTPLKENDLRYFTEADLSPGLVSSIQNQIPPYQALSLRQLTSVLKKILPVIQVQTEVKSAIDYMFRYNRVKTLHSNGQTNEEIKEEFGWSTPQLSQSYYQQRLFTIPELPDMLPYKLYNAILNQTGTDDPVVTELSNTLGATITWTRAFTGQYTFTSQTGILTINKTMVFLGPPYNDPICLFLNYVNDFTWTFGQEFSDGTLMDGLINQSVEIRVYP